MSDKNIHFTKTVKYFILDFKTPAHLYLIYLFKVFEV